ncbi:G-protein coupled receptor dmsr-1-like isoform X1 [Portunus trituberculatus]|nr:G-protein coupled receptor dmsr-1-like isoform X1 [Portunus trituberculatus]
MEGNMTDMVLRLLLTAMEKMGKDTDPEMLARFLNTTDNIDGDLTDVHSEASTQQFCRFDFKEPYRWWHYRLAVSVAVTGVVTNLLNVVTLTRPCMATPTNLLLLGLAVADLLVVTEYIPYAASMLVGGDSLVEAREYALYIITHAHLSQVCHTIAIWLTVSLALWRWVVVCRPHDAITLCTTPRARRLLLVVYLACPVVSIPTFFLYTVKEIPVSEHNPSKIYIVDMSSNKLLKEITLLVYSVVVKLVPCLLITLLIPAIIRGMWVAKNRRQRLLSRHHSCTPAAVTVVATAAAPATCRGTLLQESKSDIQKDPQGGGSLINGNVTAKKAPQLQRRDTLAAFTSFYAKAAQLAASSTPQRQTGATERSTSMLLLMMVLFLLAEAPQGVLTGMALFYGHKFFSDCYIQLGDLMDLLALTNSSINFLLYCVMCKQFWDTFVGLCCTLPRRQSKQQPHTDPNSASTKTSKI